MLAALLWQKGLEERKAEKVDMEAAGENAPKAAKKKLLKHAWIS